MLNIAIIAGYLAWPSKRVSHLITTHPSTMIRIIKQIQASITGEANDSGEYEENAREKQNIQIYRIEHKPPSNQAIGFANTMFPTQEGINQNSRFLNGKRPYSP
jgi:hypothetical protein